MKYRTRKIKLTDKAELLKCDEAYNEYSFRLEMLFGIRTQYAGLALCMLDVFVARARRERLIAMHDLKSLLDSLIEEETSWPAYRQRKSRRDRKRNYEMLDAHAKKLLKEELVPRIG